MTWEGRRLISTTKNGVLTQYSYDDSGLRLSKQDSFGITRYTYDNGKIVHQYTENNGVITNELFFRYDENGAPLSISYNGVEYFYVLNLQGDIIGIIDNTGTVVVEYTYDSWGKHSLYNISGSMASTLGVINPLRYRGYYYDTDTGFYYCNSRYYDPEVGRWISADSQLNTNSLLGYNLFAYCENNHINKADSTGHMALEGTIALTNWWNPAGWIAAAIFVVEVVFVVAATCYVVNETATAVKDTVETIDNIVNTRDQSVYVMRDKTTNEVQYVGRTNNPVRRQSEHAKDPTKANLQPLEVKFTGLTIVEARVMEQLLISSYLIENLSNARREIAVGKVDGFAGKINNIIKIFNSTAEDELLNLMGR